MRSCPRCAKEAEDRFLFCPYCGTELERSLHPIEERVSEEEYRSFIGKNADYYINKFNKFYYGKTEGFAFTWNWPAFFFGFVWMLYRKMYLWALISFLLILTPVTLPVLMVVWGLTGNYLYFWHSQKKILELRRWRDDGGSGPILAEAGGVNRWVWFFGIFLVLLILTVGVFSLLFFLFLIREVLFLVPPFIQT